MKRALLVLFILGTLFAPKANAYTNVSGSVGDFYLNIAGYISPYASVVMYSDSQFLRSTVADPGGNFYISQILVKRGFSSFCLAGEDYKRVGDSYTCFKIPPVESSVDKKNIFLPPTLGLSRTQITRSESADAFGYTMPKATVYLHLSNGTLLQTTADKDGYYIFKITNLPPGKYTIFSTAKLNGKNSEKPSKSKELTSITQVEKVRESIWQLIVRIITGLFNLIMTYIWLTIPLFILLIILILKPVRDKVREHFDKAKSVIPVDKNHLHHYWFIGY